MKEISLKDGTKIKTPWLRSSEAALYCGISRTTFDIRSIGIPFAGDKRMRLYHTKTLDLWMEGRLEIPFTKEKKGERRPRIRRQVSWSNDDEKPLVDPVNGKIY